MRSGGTPSQLNINVVGDTIVRSEVDERVKRFDAAFRLRAAVILYAIQKYLPPKLVKVVGSDGGYFMWSSFRGKDLDLVKTATDLREKHDVVFGNGVHFEAGGDNIYKSQSYAKLCVECFHQDQIQESIKLWGDIIIEKFPHLY